MRLRQFANELGISYSTALRMFRRDEIPGAYKLPSGMIVIPDSAMGALGHPTLISNENLMATMGIIEEASREILGNEDTDDLMQLIQRVLMEYYTPVTYDSD